MKLSLNNGLALCTGFFGSGFPDIIENNCLNNRVRQFDFKKQKGWI